MLTLPPQLLSKPTQPQCKLLCKDTTKLRVVNSEFYEVATTFTPKMTIVGSFERDYERSPTSITYGREATSGICTRSSSKKNKTQNIRGRQRHVLREGIIKAATCRVSREAPSDAPPAE